ncbi:MAG: Stp1/IreP family PP2C-type Ser/Thr phosphatase [Clostridia bacterium]|nr:Stp1/IreP family PP2C-type Ser/Thr phosphatase [Clostridia bacterium]
MQLFGKTDIGRVRVSNQDAYAINRLSEDTWLAVVCDGMGGANAGNVASAAATQEIMDYVNRSFRYGLSAEDHISLLQNAIRSANIAVYDLAAENPEYEGMGTTVVAVIVTPKTFVVAHVGDSRAYLFGEKAQQLTRDHSVVQNLIESGQLTQEEARRHPRKNVITRALGITEDVYADCDVFDFDENDTILLCSDGLTNFVETEDLEQIVRKTPTEQLADTLVARANYNGGGDNVTAVIVKH